MEGSPTLKRKRGGTGNRVTRQKSTSHETREMMRLKQDLRKTETLLPVHANITPKALSSTNWTTHNLRSLSSRSPTLEVKGFTFSSAQPAITSETRIKGKARTNWTISEDLSGNAEKRKKFAIFLKDKSDHQAQSASKPRLRMMHSFPRSFQAHHDQQKVIASRGTTAEAESEGVQQDFSYRCFWIGCQDPEQGSYLGLRDHVQEVHIPSQRKKYRCEWMDCRQRGFPMEDAHTLRRHVDTHLHIDDREPELSFVPS